jgi:hypothetical protein
VKKTLILFIFFLMLGGSGLIYSESSQDYGQLIIGKWKVEDSKVDLITEFTNDYEVIANGEVAGTYKFLEDKPVMMIKYENVTVTYHIQFDDDNILVRTPVSSSGKKGNPEVLKRTV